MAPSFKHYHHVFNRSVSYYLRVSPDFGGFLKTQLQVKLVMQSHENV